MSWFGETFGDSLNSLKGQITKITKDVLAEDENENGDPDSEKIDLKKLQELCAAKDLEISGLREENVKISEKFQEELKKLKAGCEKSDEGNNLLAGGQVKEVSELEDQLQQIQLETDHQEEMQKDHQEEMEKDHQEDISFVAQQRDNYKQELEKLKETHSALQVKYEELLISKDDGKGENYKSDANSTEDQGKPDELISLKEMIEKLQTQIELSQVEKDEMAKVIEKHEFNCENFKEKVEKLMEDVKLLGEEKKIIESENKKLQQMIKAITIDLNNKIEELKSEHELREKDCENLKELTKALEQVAIKQRAFQEYVDSQMRKLGNIFFGEAFDDKYPEISIPDVVREIENFWRSVSAEREISDKIYAETLGQLENDILRLRTSKYDMERDMRMEIQRKDDIEKIYRREIKLLRTRLSNLKNRGQEPLNEDETDDVRRLSQEVSRLKEDVDLKDEELRDCYIELNEIGQELNYLRSISVKAEHDLFRLSCENDGYEHSMMEVKVILDAKDDKILELMQRGTAYRDRIDVLEAEKEPLMKMIESLKEKLDEESEIVQNLESENSILKEQVTKFPAIEKELEDVIEAKSKLEEMCADLRNAISSDDLNKWENLRAQCDTKDSKISEQDGIIQDLTRELNQSKGDILKLQAVEEELKKCKKALIDMEMQRQELSDESELIKNECFLLKSQIFNTEAKDAEIQRLTRQNFDLKRCLEIEIRNKTQNGQVPGGSAIDHDGTFKIITSLESENFDLKNCLREQENVITTLTYQNNELKYHLKMANKNTKKLLAQMAQQKQDEVNVNSQDANSVPDAQGKTSSSQPLVEIQSDLVAEQDAEICALKMELEKFQEKLQRQKQEYKALQEELNKSVDKEAHLKKEVERLREHLIEMQNYYAEAIDEYKDKLSAAEEQLKNSSSFYKSNKVRDNQHLESLQTQIKLISAQRDSLQEQLSTAQDEIQKQKAALVSLHVVLEQFQQDKERECESMVAKYQSQLAASDEKFAELQQEKEALNSQLLDARNGLKAATRLGEQLEKKDEYIADLEGKVAKMEADVKELEETAKLMSQSDAEKVDKSLLKNLLLGYISSQKADRKEQVLRIMMSVLDFDKEERSKAGIDNAQSGWLANLLHPKSNGEGNSQSLSEAFIRFLESESRPRPQVKLLPDDPSNSDKSKSGSPAPKPTRLLEELVLPTFNSPQSSEGSILKDVLKNP